MDMDAEETRKMVEELLVKRAEDTKPLTVDTKGFTEELKRFTESVPEMINTAVDAAMQKRALVEEAAAAVVEAEAVAKAAAESEEQRMGMDGKKKKMMKDGKDKEMGDGMDNDEKEKSDADDRAELIMSVTSLLPKDFETRGKTNHEILVAAAGEEIERADERSDDYLIAKLEAITERRESAAARMSSGRDTLVQPGLCEGPININHMVEQKRMAAK